MKVVIDYDRCSGHGRCYALAEELFFDDDAGYGHVRGGGEVSADQQDLARRAATACPERAITLD